MKPVLLDNVRRIAAEKHLQLYTLEKLAGHCGSQIYKWDHIQPNVYFVKDVADVLGVTVDELLRDPETEREAAKLPPARDSWAAKRREASQADPARE